MPRVTEQHRQARRDEIADAAIRVLRRRGVSSTSIAQIVEESGLSAGAIYANFENKAELARYVARSLLDWRRDMIEQQTAEGAVRTPVEVVRAMLGTLRDEAPPVPLILQFWGESTTDPDLHAVVSATIDGLRTTFARAVLPWAEAQGSDDPEALAGRTARTMVVLCQGFLAHAALLDWISLDDYLDTAATIFAGPTV